MTRSFLAIAGLALALAGATLAADNFTFVILSDRTGGADQPVFERAVAEIALLRPDFVVTVGDLIEGYAGNDIRAPQWDSVLQIMRRIGCPVYYAPGNHDIGDVESARLFFEKTDRPPYYSFDKGNSHFIVLNTALAESYGQLDLLQKRWLEKDLLLSQGKQHLFVFMHKTFWLEGAARDAANDPMHQLFKKYHVTAVFCGHGHTYVSQVIDGIRYAEIGATGADLRDARDIEMGVFNQYAIARIRGNEFSFTVAEVGRVHGPELLTYADAVISEQIPNKFITYTAEMAEGQKSKGTGLRLRIKNINSVPLQGEYVFPATKNWEVTPESAAINVAPGDTQSVSFMLRNTGEYYPLPRMKFTYPFGRGKRYRWDQEANIRRIVRCPSTATPPAIDGTIDRKEWRKAAIVKQFADFTGNAAKTDPTEVYYLHDETYLYIAARCQESDMSKLRAKADARDGEVYNDDCYGFLAAAGGDTVRQLYVNANAAVWDQTIIASTSTFDEKWDCDVTAKASRDKNGWSVELRVPLSDLGLRPGTGRQLGINTRRKQSRNRESALWSTWWSYNTAQYNTIVLE